MRTSQLGHLLVAVAIVTGLPPTASAEEITFADVVARARDAAPEIAAAEARVEAGESRLRQARGYRLPDLRLTEIWMRTDSPAEAFALQLNQERFSFPDFVMSDPNDPDPIESATTRLEVSLPLYTGGELSTRIKQAELGSEAARHSAISAADGAILAAVEAYIQLAQSREYVALLERSLETVGAHVSLARAYAEQGMLVRSELLRAEVEQARIEDLVSQAHGHARLANANLSFRLATKARGDWELAPLPQPVPIADPLSTWLGSASQRPDLQAARSLLSAGELEIKAQRSGLLPKIGLLARHDLVDDTPFGTNGDSTAVMAVGTIDLWSGGRHRAAARAAEAEYAAGAKEVEQFAEAVELEIHDAWVQATTSVERHRTAAAALEAALETDRITRERFTQGVVKTIDVLDGATALREAEMRELIARADAHLARYRLAVKSGRRPETALHASGTPSAASVDASPSAPETSEQESPR